MKGEVARMETLKIGIVRFAGRYDGDHVAGVRISNGLSEGKASSVSLRPEQE